MHFSAVGKGKCTRSGRGGIGQGLCDKLRPVTSLYPSGLSVDVAKQEDLTSVQTVLDNRCRWLAQRRITQWPGGGFERQVIEKGIENGHTYLVRVGREIAGTFTLVDFDPQWGSFPGSAFYIRRFATHSSWGGRDIGGAVLEWISKRAAEDARSFVRVTIAVNDGGLPKYFARNGFEQMAEVESAGTLWSLMERPAG